MAQAEQGSTEALGAKIGGYDSAWTNVQISSKSVLYVPKQQKGEEPANISKAQAEMCWNIFVPRYLLLV